MKNLFITLCIALLLPVCVLSQAKYLGAKACMPCHKGEKKGMVWEKWLKSKHASAMKTLGSEASLAIAKKQGLKSTPMEAKECLECHSTGFGQPATAFDAKFDKTEGITCEACHGPGATYKAVHSKKGITRDESIAAGLKIKGLDEKFCIKCHNKKSPTFKEFSFKKAMETIAHKIPK